MANVFLSYKRSAEVDELLARQTHDALTAGGHLVFLDTFMSAGADWVKEIERAVLAADFMVVFLSEAAIASEMLRGEIEMARRRSHVGHGPVILPVRVAYSGPLPYPLNAYLDSVQSAVWTGAQDTPRLLAELSEVVRGTVAPLNIRPPKSTFAPPSALPQPSAPLPVPGGAMDVDDPHYVLRQADNQVVRLAGIPGQTIVITGPRQMGKSSLLLRYVQAALHHEQRIAMLDFQLLDQKSRSNSAEFFPAFTHGILDALDLSGEGVSSVWNPQLSGPQNCTRVLEKMVLADSKVPVVVAVDEVDVVFGSSFGQDFFGMTRSWHNLRANPTRTWWKSLTVVLVTSTEPFLFIDRPYESPFNVGLTYRLADFARHEIEELNKSYGSLLSNADLDALYHLLSGHPYLSRKAFYELAADRVSLRDLVASAASDHSPFGDHLRYFLLRLARIPEAAREFRKVLDEEPPYNPRLLDRLSAAGLIVVDRDVPRARCHLYETYYKNHL
jgi:hypothetical protein